MKDAMGVFLRQSGLGSKLRPFEVYDCWKQVVGAKLAQRARPVKFTRGELVVQVDSAPHLHELQNFTGEQYRARLNQRLGAEKVRTLVFKAKR